MIMRLSFVLSFAILFFFGLARVVADEPVAGESESSGETGEEVAYDDAVADEPTALAEAELEEEDVELEEKPEKEPKERTPMAMPAFAPFSESQRGVFPVVNPSFPSHSDRRFRFGTLFEFGFGMEVGDVDDDWVDDVTDLFDDFEDLEELARRLREEYEQNQEPSQAEREELRDGLIDFRDGANDLVNDLASRAYIKVLGNVSFPLTPIAVRSDALSGMFSLSADGFFEGRGAIFETGDAFILDLRPGDEITDIRVENETEIIEVERQDGSVDEVRVEATEDAGVAVQGGAVGRLGAGYSRAFVRNDRGALHAGTTVSLFHASMFRAGVLFDEDEDAIEDAIDDGDRSSAGFGVDLGATWVGKRYLVGGVIRNINEPSFDYPDTSNDPFFVANPEARRNGESWTMERQYTLQSAVFTADKRWVASAALDLNSVTDTTGDDFQWASILGSFEPARAWVPSPRLGLRSNLAGEKMTYVTAGLSFFRALHLDVSSTLDTIKVDGDTVPRGFQANIALGRRF